jgi:2-polyprenyl-6-methoxyphenol hydroxylase-like FAD-dependent oxidoreductase
MALEDAEALAKLLKHHLQSDEKGGHLVACNQFYDFRKDRVMRIYRQGQKAGDRKREKSAVGEVVAFVLIRIMGELRTYIDIAAPTSS